MYVNNEMQEGQANESNLHDEAAISGDDIMEV